MLRLPVVFVVLLLSMASFALEEVPESTDIEPWSVFDKEEVLTVGFANLFVPMGRPARFHCAAVDSLRISGETITAVEWVLRHASGSAQIRHVNESTEIRHANGSTQTNSTAKHERFMMNGTDEPVSTLYGYALQSEHDGMFECHVLHGNPLEKNVTHETVSRIRLYVQDCDDAGESSNYRNLMNPCFHGVCQIEETNKTWAPYYLSCDCVEQFTGEYCDVEVEGTRRRELIFWSPIIFYFVAVATLCVLAHFAEKRSRRPRISLEGLVPKQPPPVPEHCQYSANPLLDEEKLDALLKALLEEDEDAPSKASKKSGPEKRN